jgi:uncharacterized membrane protein
MSKENDELNDRLDKISEAIVFLTEKVSSVEQRVNKESGISKAPRMPIDLPPKPRYETPKTIFQEHSKPDLLDKSAREEVNAVPKPIANPDAYFVSGGSREFNIGNEEIKAPQEEGGLEKEIGLKWLGRAGILLLILGIAFFMKYAFENDWIPEALRVVMGILSGMVLIYLGDSLRQKYASYASLLTGGGIAVLYLSIYSSFAYYHLIDQVPAFGAMMIITAIGSFFAIRYEQASLAVFSILGGFLTPVLLSTGTNNQIGLFSYMTILNLGVLAISFYRNWQKLNLLGLVATLFLYFGWSATYYEPEVLFITEAFLTLWFIIYSVAIVSHNILSKKESDVFDLVLIILNALSYFGISYFLLDKNYGDYIGFFTVLMAMVYFIFAYVSYQANSEDRVLTMFFSGISIIFLTISAPIQFDGIWVTIAWAIEAAILVKAGFMLRSYSLRFFSWILLGIVVVRLLFIDSFETVPLDDYMLILNKRFLTFVVGVVSFSAVYYLYSKFKDLVSSEESSAKSISLFLINFLLLWALSSEVSVYFNNQAKLPHKIIQYPSCENGDYVGGRYVEDPRCAQEFDRYYANQKSQVEKIQDNKSAETATLTVLWSLYAIMLLAFGMRGKNRLLRLMGLGLFIVAIAKAFWYGLVTMEGIYRIIAFIALGALLLIASFAYNKYKDKLKEII